MSCPSGSVVLYSWPSTVTVFLWIGELWTDKIKHNAPNHPHPPPALGGGLSGWLSLPRTDPQVTRHCAAGINNARHFLQPPRRENYVSLHADWQRHKKRRGSGIRQWTVRSAAARADFTPRGAEERRMSNKPQSARWQQRLAVRSHMSRFSSKMGGRKTSGPPGSGWLGGVSVSPKGFLFFLLVCFKRILESNFCPFLPSCLWI